MTKIVFVGAYGIHSQGDDAALLCMAQGLRSRLGDFEAYVLTRHASERTYERWGLHSVASVEYETKAQSEGRWFRGLNFDDDRSILTDLMDLVASCSLMVIGVGSHYSDTVIDTLRGPLPHVALMSVIARMCAVPSMLYSVSVGPLTTAYGKRLTYLSADLASAVTVRDANSVDLFRSVGFTGDIALLPDAVLGLDVESMTPSGAVPSKERSGLTIGVSLRNLGGANRRTTEELVDRFAEVTRLLVEELGARVRLIPHCTYAHGYPSADDRNVARAMLERMEPERDIELVDEDLTVERCLALYADLDACVSMRLHSSVYAALHGVPSVAIEYNRKVGGFMQWLGGSDRVLGADDFEPTDVVRAVGRILAEREVLSAQILERVAQGRREVGAYADIAAELATGQQRTGRRSSGGS
jgi:colanic acid/amylovoran biosynthesis protein